MGQSMSAAEIAAVRHLLGVSGQWLADELGNNLAAVRQREAGSRRVTEGVADEMRELLAEHTRLVEVMLSQKVVRVPYAGPDRGWYLGAAARALAVNPDLRIEWEKSPG